MDRTGCYDYTVEQRDVDFRDKATYVAVMNYILQAAGDDADRNGFGIKDLNHDNCSWVLTRMAVEFGRDMERNERFTIRTWVNDVNRMATTRNMVVTDQAGQCVASAVTNWAVIDIDKRMSIDIRAHVDYESCVTAEPCPVEKPRKIAAAAAGSTTTHKVVYSDMDFNNHVTAVRYITWMFDMLPLEYITDRGLARIDVLFLHEALYGQTLSIGLEDSADRSVFSIENEDGLSLCKAAMTWK